MDPIGRLVELEGPQGFRQQFFFDDQGRPVQRIEADGSQQFNAYDDMDRLASETGPDGREQQYRYDEAGQLIERIEANRTGPDDQPLVTRYDYDNVGRLTARHLPATEHAPASTEQYQWDTNGQLLSVTNDHGEVSFSYDHAQRLIGEQQRHTGLEEASGWTWQHQHSLTANGAPQASQFGAPPALNWHTYGSGHLHGMSVPGLDLEIALEPDALHRETQRRLSTNEHNQPMVLERGYTNLGQLDHLTLRSPNTTSQQAYQYDALGRMSFRSLQGDPAEKVIACSYDAAGRLIGSQHGDHAHRYSVDAAGNRLDGQQALSDNRLGQLNGARYRYDGLGRRISKTVRHTTATTHYGWDGDRIVREDTENQRTTVVYEPGSFVPMLRIDDTQQGQVLSAYITDALGTPMQLVTPIGQPRWLAEPDDWAAVKNQRAVRNVTQPIRLQGQWHDEESGLYYNRHRYYDPQQGRYISQDPIGLRGGTNLYGYVTNPAGMVDPLGLEGETPWRYKIDRDVHPIRNVPKMFMQFVHQAVLPSKETATTVSNVAAVCSLAPPLTSSCGPVSLGASIYAAGIEAVDGNGRQAAADIAPTIASETTGHIFKRAEIVTDGVSNAIGVAAGFKTQFWGNKDNHIASEQECSNAE